MTVLKKAFSIKPKDLDGVRGMLEGMARDVATQWPQVVKRNPQQQQNASESGPQQGGNESTATPPTGQPAPLNAANLEKQTQALNKMHQRTASKGGQAPAAPTTSQPPFPFGAQSPNGQPTYIGKPTITQADLNLPARKKIKTGAQSGVASGGPSANSSPQVQKAPSPEMVKRPASTEVKAAPKLAYQCPEQSCEAHVIGFATDEALRNHYDEEHVKPYQNPMQFALESAQVALGLDSNGKSIAPPKATASTMVRTLSKQGQTPGKTEATPMSRDASMRRQLSGPGSKPTDLSKTIAGKADTPKADYGATGPAKTDAQQPFGADNSWMTTIDPQDLFTIGGLESGGNGAISDMNVYRAITPNDTPESTGKESSSSEPNSDVSEGVSLNLTLDMGFDTWRPFEGGLDLGPTEMDPNKGNDVFAEFTTWDDVQIDFDKPFPGLDISQYSLDTT